MEDYNEPSLKRAELLRRLQDKIGSVTPHFWAACQICDLQILEDLIVEKELLYIHGFEVLCGKAIHHWSSAPTSPSGLSMPTPLGSTTLSPSTLPSPSKRQRMLDPSTSLPRDKNVRKRAEERDGSRCVLTGTGMIDTAHIYPYHAMRHSETDKGGPRHLLWVILREFWSEEKVAAWKAKLFPQGIDEKGQEEVYNLISLTPTVRRIWEQGLFALKPISQSDDKTALTIRFFWQEKRNDIFPRTHLTTEPISSRGLEQTAGVWIFDKHGNKIKSGDYFVLHTDDPTRMPLPSFELLELQWFLHRIRGMAGAGDDDDEGELDDWPDIDSNSET